MTTSASCARSSLSADVRRPHGEREDEPRAALWPILGPDVTALAAHELATSTWPGARLERATAIRRVERSGQNLRALSIRLPRICRKRSASARTRGTSAATVSTRRRDPRCAVRAAATMMSSTTRLIPTSPRTRSDLSRHSCATGGQVSRRLRTPARRCGSRRTKAHGAPIGAKTRLVNNPSTRNAEPACAQPRLTARAPRNCLRLSVVRRMVPLPITKPGAA
jgi:hypothetical protein